MEPEIARAEIKKTSIVIDDLENKYYFSFGDLSAQDKEKLAEAYVARGLVFSQINATDEACKDYSAALQWQPDFWQAYYLRFRLSNDRKDFELAYLYAAADAMRSGQQDLARKYYFLLQSRCSAFLRLYANLKQEQLKIPNRCYRPTILLALIELKSDGTANQELILALAQHQVGKLEEMKFDLSVMKNLSIFLYEDFLRLLMDPDCQKATTISGKQPSEVKQIKDFLIHVLENTKDKKLLLNACLQGLCKSTRLGSIFYVQRGFFAPSITGLGSSLKQIGQLINSQADLFTRNDVSETTRAALCKEQEKNPNFFKDLDSKYPELGSCLGEFLKSKVARESDISYELKRMALV